MFEIDLSWRSADLALTVAEKAMRAAERALKGGSAPASSPVPGSILSVPDPLWLSLCPFSGSQCPLAVEEPEPVVVSQGGGPSTEQIMEHVRVGSPMPFCVLLQQDDEAGRKVLCTVTLPFEGEGD